MSHCHGLVVGTVLLHAGRVAVAIRQKFPRFLAPSAGHVEPSDGLGEASFTQAARDAARLAAVRELAEETGFDCGSLPVMSHFTHQATDPCGKSRPDGGPGGNHLWYVFAHVLSTEPELRDEPSKMHDWRFVPYNELMADDRLEPIWREMLPRVSGLVRQSA